MKRRSIAQECFNSNKSSRSPSPVRRPPPFPEADDSTLVQIFGCCPAPQWSVSGGKRLVTYTQPQ